MTKAIFRCFILLMLFCCLPCLAFIDKVCYERTFYGLIGDNLKIHMNLRIEDKKVTGDYFYDRIKEKIEIQGNVDDQNNITITESDGTGTISGKFVSLDRIEGTWSDPNSTKKLSFWVDTEYVKDPIDNFVHLLLPNTYGDYAELLYINTDMNNDGLKDFCICQTTGWGQHNGGPWYVYFQKPNGLYYHSGSLFFAPSAMSIQPIRKNETRVVIYYRFSGKEGAIAEFIITSNGIKLGRSTSYTADGAGGDLKFEKPFGEELLKVLDNQKFEPLVRKCSLSDYLQNKKCEWSNY